SGLADGSDSAFRLRYGPELGPWAALRLQPDFEWRHSSRPHSRSALFPIGRRERPSSSCRAGACCAKKSLWSAVLAAPIDAHAAIDLLGFIEFRKIFRNAVRRTWRAISDSGRHAHARHWRARLRAQPTRPPSRDSHLRAYRS